MAEANVDMVREGHERFVASGEFPADLSTPDFVWDMSNFHGWPGQQVYEGAAGVRAFLSEWIDTWDDWELMQEAVSAAGDMVVALMHQRGRSKAGGVPVEMSFAMVFTFRGGRQARMDMYSDRDEALAAAGLSE